LYFNLIHIYSTHSHVKTIIIYGIKYTAPNKYKQIGNAQIGYVEAWDLEGGNKLWDKNIYYVPIKPIIEADVQGIVFYLRSTEKQNKSKI
jgi:hypothetical protein